MTDRINGFTVVLEKDIREDDAEATRKAIEQIKGVISVQGIVTTPDDIVASFRTKMDIVRKLHKFTSDLTNEK